MTEPGKPLTPLPLPTESLWKLAEAKAGQLKDSAAAARIPFLLALTWSFVWAAAIYSHDYGYVSQVVERFESTLVGDCPCTDERTIGRYHPALAEAAMRVPHGSGPKHQLVHEACAAEIHGTLDEVRKQRIETWFFSIPWIGVHTSVFDYSIVGNSGTLLLLLWFYYTSRRENHAIRSFVDAPKRRSSLFFRKYTLATSPESNLKAVHLAYAYELVSQRFVFLTSRRSWPLLLATCVLIWFPCIVSVWNAYTDLRDLEAFDLRKSAGGVVLFGCILALFVAFLSISITLRQLRTAAILNGWYLACRDVWRDENPPLPVEIDPGQQRAAPFRPPEPATTD